MAHKKIVDLNGLGEFYSKLKTTNNNFTAKQTFNGSIVTPKIEMQDNGVGGVIPPGTTSIVTDVNSITAGTLTIPTPIGTTLMFSANSVSSNILTTTGTDHFISMDNAIIAAMEKTSDTIAYEIDYAYVASAQHTTLRFTKVGYCLWVITYF